jgi:nucleoside-diphosphate-sugar epimerase
MKPKFSISTINPSVVMGPPIILPSSGSKLNETLRPIWDIFSGATTDVPPYIGTGSFVDVRNVATMHIWAFENAKKSDGERYLGVQGFGPMQAAADILNDAYKGTEIGEKITKGTPGEGYVGYDKETGKVDTIGPLPGARRISGQKAVKEMGLQYIPFKQSIVDTAKALEALT